MGLAVAVVLAVAGCGDDDGSTSTPPPETAQPLPKLPLWLTEELAVELDLESAYEETCRVLRIV